MGVAGRTVHSWILYPLIILLAGYVAVDFGANHTHTLSPALCRCSKKPLLPLSGQQDDAEPALLCKTVQGHLDHSYKAPVHGINEKKQENPWKQMKWVGEPATCRVKGHLIEKLDPTANFRRGFSLKFASDVEDKTHLLPWLMATRVNMNARKRRVFLDLGANSFSTSITWFLRMYPCDFTEIHAFEVDEQLLKKPAKGFREEENQAADNAWSVMVKKQPGIPQWMLDRIRVHYEFVSDLDDEDNRAINITRLIKEELKLTANDAVVVKMDIEGSEWPILRRWMQDPEMAAIVDELFVEVHYDHPSMRGYHWGKFAPTKRKDAMALLAELRFHGFFAHAWP